MLILLQDDSLQLITASGVSTDYIVTYDDLPGPQQQSTQGNIATATTTTILSAPTPRISRRVSDVYVRNRHATSSQTVTLVRSVAGTAYYFTSDVTLKAGESFHYTNKGFDVFDAVGRRKTTGVSNNTPAIMMSPTFAVVNHSDTKSISGGSHATYVGKLPRNVDYVTTRYRVATASSIGASEWAEIALAKGAPVAGSNPTLTVVGWVSAEGTAAFASIGVQSTIVSVRSGYNLSEGDDLWIIVAASVGSGAVAPVIRAAAHDIIMTGGHATATNRPSSILGTPTAFTIAAVSVSTAWVAGII